MSLLDDFKTASGATESNSYIINYYLKPALDRAATITANIKNVSLTLGSAKTYDMTDGSIASPVVSNGVQDLVEPIPGLNYKKEFYFKNRTELVFLDTPSFNSMEFDYYSYYSIPVDGGADTDADEVLYPAIIRLAKAYYAKDGLVTAGGNGSGVNTKSNVTEISEANLRVKYAGGSGSGQLAQINAMITDAERELKSINGRNSYFQVMTV